MSPAVLPAWFSRVSEGPSTKQKVRSPERRPYFGRSFLLQSWPEVRAWIDAARTCLHDQLLRAINQTASASCEWLLG